MKFLTKKFMEHFSGTPVGVFSLFTDSFVQVRACGDNRYVLDNGVPVIEVAPFGYNNDVALFHELGHFSAIDEHRLLKQNYGFPENNGKIQKTSGYGDLLHEIKVIAFEWNLMQWFGYKPDNDKKTYPDWLIYAMPGTQNFVDALDIKSDDELKTQIRRLFLEIVDTEEYASMTTFIRRWEARNDFLRTCLYPG